MTKVDWEEVSWRQDLTEKFIEKNLDKISWKYISASQKLTKKFIEKHAEEIDWAELYLNAKISDRVFDYINKVKSKYLKEKKNDKNLHCRSGL